MESILLSARLLLAAVFAIAGVAKLTDRAGTNQAIIDFGLPTTVAPKLAILLPLSEILIALSLVPLAMAWWGAIGAMILILIFIIGIVFNLAQGRKPDCHCFGQLYSKSIGWQTILRNGGLALIAGFIIFEGRDSAGASAFTWLQHLSVEQTAGISIAALLLIIVAIEGWFMLNLLQQNGRLLLRVEALEGKSGIIPPYDMTQPIVGLPIGSEAPSFELSGFYEETITLETLQSIGKPLILIFTDFSCSPCNALLPEIADWQRKFGEKLTIALISRGDAEVVGEKISKLGLTHILLQREREVALSYLAYGTPSAVSIKLDGTIGSFLSMGADAIRKLIEQIVPEPSAMLVSANRHKLSLK